MERDTTTIEISIETYKNLGSRKKPSESFDDVVARCLLERDRLDDDAAEAREMAVRTIEDWEYLDSEEKVGTLREIADTLSDSETDSISE